MPATSPILSRLLDALPRVEPVKRSLPDTALDPHGGLLLLFAREHLPRGDGTPPDGISFADGTKDALVSWAIDFTMREMPPVAGLPSENFRDMWTALLTPVVDSIMTAVRSGDFSHVAIAARMLDSMLRLRESGDKKPRVCRFTSDNTLSLSRAQPTQVILPLSEGMLLKLVSAATASAIRASPASATAGMGERLQALKATLCEQPFTIDVARARPLWQSRSPAQAAEFESLRAAYRAQRRLAGLGVVPLPRLIDSDSVPGSPQAPDGPALRSALGATGGNKTPIAASELLQQSLKPIDPTPAEREAGRWSFASGPRESTADLHVAPLPATHSTGELAAQDKQFQLLRDFVLGRFFLARRPVHRLDVSLDGDAIRVGRLVVARKSTTGAWLADRPAIQEVLSATVVSRSPDKTPVDQWWDASAYRFLEPRVRAATVRTLRLYLQMEADGAESWLTRYRYPDEAVWIQIDRQGGQRIVAGEAVLARLAPDHQVKLEIAGHGHLGESGARELSHYAPSELVGRVKNALDALGLSRPAGAVTLISCALETPAVRDSYAELLLNAGIEQGVLTPRARVTAYSDILSLSTRFLLLAPRVFIRPRLARKTFRFDGAPLKRHAPEKTWIYSIDPATGRVARRDKYPAAPGQTEADTTVLEYFAGGNEGCAILGRAGRIADRLRPSARHHLMPSRIDLGRPYLSFFDERSGTMTTRALDVADDARLMAAYMTGLSGLVEGASGAGATAYVDPLGAEAPDGLNIGLLALAFSQLSRQSRGGTAHQAALMYIGLSQGGAFLTADVTTLAEMVHAAMRSADPAVASGVAQAGRALARGLRGLGALAQGAMVGMDVATLIDAVDSTDASAVTAGVQLGFDGAGLLLMGGGTVAGLAGAGALGAVLSDLATPVAGIAIGVTGLVHAVGTEKDRLRHNLQPLHRIDAGYDTPLQPIRSPGSSTPSRLLHVAPWAPVDRIDFVRGEVGFANATIGQSSARRVLSVFSDDDADKQGSFWRHGENLDLWTMLWKPGRQADPVATLTQAQRDPANILLLAAPPVVDIDFEAYSNGRPGAATLDDALLDRLRQRSGDRFIGDYVASMSMARSADVWHYAYRRHTVTVVLDDATRTLALPSRTQLDAMTFTFKNNDGVADRTIHPMDPSLVDYRIVGGGGATVLALPGDGLARPPITLVPSGRPGEQWTFVLDGALSDGGKPFEFLDGDAAGTGAGLRLDGQTFRFESMPDAPVAIVDTRFPTLSVRVDLRRQSAALVVDVGRNPSPQDPFVEAATHLHALRKTAREGGLTSLALPQQPEGMVLLAARGFAWGPPGPGEAKITPTGLPPDTQGRYVPLDGYVDLGSGRAVLRGEQNLWIHDPDPMSPMGADRWLRMTDPATIDPWGRPVVQGAGNHHVKAVSFTLNWDTGVFERNALQLTDAGADWVSRWMAHRDAWTPAQLIGDLRAQGLLDGLDLQGPGGSRSPEDPLSVFHVAPDPSDVSTADGPVARRPYASFSIAEEAQTLVDLEGNRFEQRGRMLLVSLKEHLNTMFHLGRRHGIDAGDVQSLNFLSTSPRRILLQGNGRDVDLSAALGMQGVDEVVILPEGDDARRRLHVDEGTDADLRCAFNGRDLLLFDAARPSSPLIRVRDALRVGDHASGHALIADPRLTVLLHRSGSGQPLPTTHQWLDTPILTLHAGRMALQRDGGDLVARSSDGWDEERLSGFFDPDAPGNDAAKAPQDAALMVRLRGDAGGWAFGRLNNNNLLDMMAAQDAFGTPSSFDWSIDERADSRLRVPNLTTDAQGRVTAGTFKLQAALLSDYVAAMPPAASTDTVLRFLPEQELPSWAGAGPDFPSTNRHSFTAS